jgi:glutathione S-transferase
LNAFFWLLAVPYTTLPFLDVDGIRIGQSLAVARYLAKKVGISGRNLVEEALADGIVDFVSDCANS